MDTKTPVRFTLGRQSSMAPERHSQESEVDRDQEQEEVDGLRLMYLANEGDLEGIRELLDSGIDVNFRDMDDRTANHIAACQGLTDVVALLLHRGALVDPKDRWGSTPLSDAIHYKNHDVIKLLEKHGAKLQMASMHVKHPLQVPEYEIESKELDFSHSVELTKGTFQIASWRGTQVAVKKLKEDVFSNDDKVRAFRDELALLQKIRHPNVVQFLGAVTQSSPLMIVTEYLPKGDFRAYLNRKGALKPIIAVRFALDIARVLDDEIFTFHLKSYPPSQIVKFIEENLNQIQKHVLAQQPETCSVVHTGMNYLHENKPAIIHLDLEPSNMLLDDSGHLKVADFGVSKLLTVKEDKPLTCQDTSCRYMAPEVFRDEEYDTKVDVFSFSLILQEMIEGYLPFSATQEIEVPKVYAARKRPPFRAPAKYYAYGLKELIEECWNENPAKRPTFRQIITRLESIHKSISNRRHWKVRPLMCFHNLEAMLKKDQSNRSSGSSSHSTGSI